MYHTVAVGNVLIESCFTVAEGDTRNAIVAEGAMLVFKRNSVKG